MSERRDAEEVPQWKPEDGVPPYMHYFDDHDFLSVNVRLDGTMHRAVAKERLDYPDGRRALTLAVWPKLSDGRRVVRAWWDPDAVRVSSHGTSPVEATVCEGDARRLREGDWPPGPFPRTTLMTGRPFPVRVRVGGQWHEAQIFRRYHFEDGREAVQTRVTFVEADWPVGYWRHYWWDPEAFEPR